MKILMSRLGLNPLHEHKFKSNIQDTRNLHLWLISSQKDTLFSKKKLLILIIYILNQADATITKALLFGNSKYSNEANLQILNASIDFILTSKRFGKPLLNS